MSIVDLNKDGGLTPTQEMRLSIAIKLEWHLKINFDCFDFLRIAHWVMTGEYETIVIEDKEHDL